MVQIKLCGKEVGVVYELSAVTEQIQLITVTACPASMKALFCGTKVRMFEVITAAIHDNNQLQISIKHTHDRHFCAAALGGLLSSRQQVDKLMDVPRHCMAQSADSQYMGFQRQSFWPAHSVAIWLL